MEAIELNENNDIVRKVKTRKNPDLIRYERLILLLFRHNVLLFTCILIDYNNYYKCAIKKV